MGNPKRFYGYMRGLQSVKDCVMAFKKTDGTQTATDVEAANELANCFQQMFTKDEGVDQGNHDCEAQKVSDCHCTRSYKETPEIKD